MDHPTRTAPPEAPADGAPLGVPPALDRAAAGGGQPPVAHACSNCGATLTGPYCAQCGQKAAHRMVSLGHILEDAVEDQFSLNAALPRTLGVLLRYPGRLTGEYVSGRVVRYIPPMRLYLMASVLFFLVLAAMPGRASDVNVQGPGQTRAPAARTAVRKRVAAFNIQVGPVSIQADTVGIPQWLRPPVLRLIAHKERLQRMDPQEARRQLVTRMADDTPKVVFVLLPVFALLLKLLYIRRHRLYVEHFVFALHVHALAFLVFTLALLARYPFVSLAAYVGIAFYLLRAMRVVYGQGWGRTTAKFALLAFSYLILASLGLSIAVAVAVASI